VRSSKISGYVYYVITIIITTVELRPVLQSSVTERNEDANEERERDFSGEMMEEGR
jgi:hypothetical protein